MLGFYGLGNGCYLVLPVFGPSSLRDGAGTAGAVYLSPLGYTNLTWAERSGIRGLQMTNALSLDKDTYEQIKRDAIDPYLFIRSAYVQRRQAQIAK